MNPICSAALIVLLTASNCFAWSTKEHILLTRIAVLRLIEDPATPPEMTAWLKVAAADHGTMEDARQYFLQARNGIVPRNVDGIAYWATIPDLNTFTDHPNSKVEPFNVHERLLHYVDLEFFHPDETKRRYHHDLSGKPTLQDIPNDFKDARYERAGMLPFRVEQIYQELMKSLRAGRMTDKPGEYPRDDHAARWAGFLAHYLQDNTQPHHATVDYKSQSYFADARKAPNVHAQMEYEMIDGENDDFLDLRERMWPLFIDALNNVEVGELSLDRGEAVLQIAMRSYDYLPLIGQAAMVAGGQVGAPDSPTGGRTRDDFDTRVFYRFKAVVNGSEMSIMEMKSLQLALAVKRVEQVWRQAWHEAYKRD